MAGQRLSCWRSAYGTAQKPRRLLESIGVKPVLTNARRDFMKIRRLTSQVFFFSLLVACIPFTAGAVDEMDFNLVSTKNLYNLCSVAPDNQDFIPAIYACRGFIEAAVQYHDAVSDRRNLKRLICYTPDATIKDGRDAFVAWVEKHRNDQTLMEEMPVIGLVRALAEKYPCSE
jgi:hypothetical protein